MDTATLSRENVLPKTFCLSVINETRATAEDSKQFGY